MRRGKRPGSMGNPRQPQKQVAKRAMAPGKPPLGSSPGPQEKGYQTHENAQDNQRTDQVAERPLAAKRRPAGCPSRLRKTHAAPQQPRE
jgi:hypothetical protein